MGRQIEIPAAFPDFGGGIHAGLQDGFDHAQYGVLIETTGFRQQEGGDGVRYVRDYRIHEGVEGRAY